jgi:hypothetical protein
MTKEELLERCIVLNRRINYAVFVARECCTEKCCSRVTEDTYFYSWFKTFFRLGFISSHELTDLMLSLNEAGVCEFLRDGLRTTNKNSVEV